MPADTPQRGSHAGQCSDSESAGRPLVDQHDQCDADADHREPEPGPRTRHQLVAHRSAAKSTPVLARLDR